MSENPRPTPKQKKTFVIQRQDTHQSLIFQQQLNMNAEYINLNHIFAKYCHPKHHRISIYSHQDNQFINIRKVKNKNGWVGRALLDPQFILIRYCSREELATKEDSDSSMFELNSRDRKEERSKERTIGEVLELVKRWRNLHETCPKPNNKKKKVNLQEAARIVGISKKSLDDYYCQLRLAESYQFDFQSQMDQKIGVLRTFVKNHKGEQQKKPNKLHQKHPKDLKAIHDSSFPSQSHPDSGQNSRSVPAHPNLQNLQQSLQKKQEPPVVLQQQKMNDLEHQFYRGFEFLLDQPMDPFLNLNRNFSVRFSDDQSNSLLFL